MSETYQIMTRSGRAARCPYCHRGKDFYLDSDECPICGNTLPSWMLGILRKENKRRRKQGRRSEAAQGEVVVL